MDTTSHLSSLKQKHQNLSQEVEKAHRSPGIDTLEIAQLKREKLRLKEEIERYSA